MKHLILILLVLIPSLSFSKECSLDEAVEMMEKVDPFFSPMAGWNLLHIGFCDEKNQDYSCCMEVGFETDEALGNVARVYPNGLNLFGKDVLFSSGPIQLNPILKKAKAVKP